VPAVWGFLTGLPTEFQKAENSPLFFAGFRPLFHLGGRRQPVYLEIQLREDSSGIHLLVSDSGRGFDLETAMQGRGLGLTSMEERVRLVNGTISVDSKPMYGTTIRVRVPLVSGHEEQRAAG
jgi:signal transduction histidine kinase